MWKFLAYIALILISPQVCAVIFEPSPTDKSVELLGVIFGTSIGDIYLGGAPNSALAELMEKFNFIIVVAGLIVVSYAGIMSTINTAQEGTVMGKKWSAIWIPMRSVAGMALMIPAPGSGYSMIQVTVMWIIMQGIGAADALWTIVMDNLKSGVSASTGTNVSDEFGAREKGKDLAKSILRYAVCMKHYHETSKAPAATKPSSNDYPTYDFWRAQTEHFNDNDGDGDYVANNGGIIKFYTQVTKDATYSTKLPTATINNGATSTGAEMVGYAKFGDSGNSSYASVCGQIRTTVRVYDRDLKGSTTNVGGQIEQTEPATPAELQKAVQDVYAVKQNIFSTMLATLQPLADKIVERTDFISAEEENLDDEDYTAASPYIENAINAYVQLSSSLVTDFEGIQTEEQSKVAEAADQAIADGWITAGSYYFTLNKTMTSKKYYIAEHPDDDPSPIKECIKPEPDDEKNSSKTCTYRLKGLNSYDFDLLRTSFQIAGIFVEESQKGNGLVVVPEETEDTGETTPSTDVLNLAGSGLGEAINAMKAMFNRDDNTDPLYSHAQFGLLLMQIAEGIWGGILAVGAAAAAASLIAVLSPTPLTILSAAFTVMLIVTPILVTLWLFGAGLAIYAPFIPYMIFALAALGWLLVVVESIIAAPLIALGLVVPAGDELGKISTALALLANIFLRPMLMVLGFILASRVYAAILNLVDYGMAAVLADSPGSTPLSGLAVIVVYVSFVISLTNTSFSLIYAVPDKILRWLGGPHEQTNVGALEETKGRYEGAMKEGSEEAKTGIDAAGTGAKGIAEGKAEGRREAAAAKKKLEQDKKNNPDV